MKNCETCNWWHKYPRHLKGKQYLGWCEKLVCDTPYNLVCYTDNWKEREPVNQK